mgnify:FL=1
MIKAILAFFAVWAIVFVGISFFWHSPMSEKIDMVKMGFYSFMTALIACVLLTILVVVF